MKTRSPTRSEILSLLQEQRAELARRYSVRSIGLFGSVARDEAGPQSDVDLLVEFESPTFDHFMDLKFYLEDLLGRPVDLVTKNALRPALRSIVLGEIRYAA